MKKLYALIILGSLMLLWFKISYADGGAGGHGGGNYSGHASTQASGGSQGHPNQGYLQRNTGNQSNAQFQGAGGFGPGPGGGYPNAQFQGAGGSGPGAGGGYPKAQFQGAGGSGPGPGGGYPKAQFHGAGGFGPGPGGGYVGSQRQNNAHRRNRGNEGYGDYGGFGDYGEYPEIEVNNEGQGQYDEGYEEPPPYPQQPDVYYTAPGNYVVVPPPLGSIIFAIPSEYRRQKVHGVLYYTNKETYYVQTPDGYEVVAPPMQ